MILALNLPPGTPWHVCLIGSFLGIVFGKQIFGGLGHNPFNPAIVARIGLLIAFPKIMTTWSPTRLMAASPDTAYDTALLGEKTVDALKSMSPLPFFSSMDGITCATPLGIAKGRKRRRRGRREHQLLRRKLLGLFHRKPRRLRRRDLYTRASYRGGAASLAQDNQVANPAGVSGDSRDICHNNALF